MLFESACDMYITDRRKRLRMNTIEGYESAIRCHLLPRWSGREIESISDTELQDWVDGFELPGAAEKAFKTFRQVIRWSMRKLRLRMYDPTMAGIELPKKQPYRPKVLDAAGERSYLRALYGHECEAVAICSVTLGLRRGEACGLRWEDIDLRTGEVRVRRSRQVVSGEVVEVPPKTAKSARSCWLPRFAVQRLKAIRNGARGLLCELDPDTVARRIKAACRRAGAEWVSMTSCRHTWATLAVEAGVGIETIAMMMGHSNITTAYEHYIVPRPKICKDAQKAIERLVLSS
ncbi:MAG: tyrosine-type recombinase/integrase [Collinsella sp.]|uniref:tyrosine-type recombinase/integrase n=1 Tax=Collinsella sp. TaxID=1965294 RepID=UPI00399047B5